MKFSKPEFWDNVPEGSALLLEIPKFSHKTVWNWWKEASMLNSFSRFATIPACDGQTDRRTQDDSKYRAPALA